MKREDILKTAMHLVTKDRQQDYGNANDNLSLAAELIDAYLKNLDRPMLASDVAMINVLQKVARSVFGHKMDNAIDIAGYAALYGELRADEVEFEQKMFGSGMEPIAVNQSAEKLTKTEAVVNPESNVVTIKPGTAK